MQLNGFVNTAVMGARARRPTLDARAPVAACAAAVAAFWLYRQSGPSAAAAFVLSGATAWLLVPWVIRLAGRVGATVSPGGRSVHSIRTPLLGGLAIMVPLVLALLALGWTRPVGLGIGCLMIAMVGGLDDLRGASPRLKIMVQVGAALVLFGTGHRLSGLDCPPFGTLQTGPWELPLLVAWVVLVTNAINLVDGLDGLAAGLCFFAALACAALGYGGVAAIVLAGALLGFLRHNLAPARVFLGDTGSLMLGFALSALLLDGPAGLNVPVAVGVLALPLGDVFLSAARRWLRGKPIFTADRGHVHHLLLNLWRSPNRVFAALLLFAGVHVALAIEFQSAAGLGLTCLVWAAFCGYLLVVTRSRWSRILRHRRSFQRAHAVRRYARAVIGLAESEEEVRSALLRVAADFDLTLLKMNGVEIRNGSLNGAAFIEETVDCGGTAATWRMAASVAEDPVYVEERHSILCELLRVAADRLRALAAAAESRRGGFAVVGGKPPRVDFLLGRHDHFDRLRLLVDETRRNGRLDPRIVSRFERYGDLLEKDEPALVVVIGNSDDASRAVAAARTRGIPVTNVDTERGRMEGQVELVLNGVLAARRET